MIAELHTKDPDETLDYVVDWNGGSQPFLNDDTIVASSWIVQEGITSELQTNTVSTATIWLSGGTLGSSYLITNRINTAGGRIADHSFKVRIRQK